MCWLSFVGDEKNNLIFICTNILNTVKEVFYSILIYSSVDDATPTCNNNHHLVLWWCDLSLTSSSTTTIVFIFVPSCIKLKTPSCRRYAAKTDLLSCLLVGMERNECFSYCTPVKLANNQYADAHGLCRDELPGQCSGICHDESHAFEPLEVSRSICTAMERSV